MNTQERETPAQDLETQASLSHHAAPTPHPPEDTPAPNAPPPTHTPPQARLTTTPPALDALIDTQLPKHTLTIAGKLCTLTAALILTNITLSSLLTLSAPTLTVKILFIAITISPLVTIIHPFLTLNTLLISRRSPLTQETCTRLTITCGCYIAFLWSATHLIPAELKATHTALSLIHSSLSILLIALGTILLSRKRRLPTIRTLGTLHIVLGICVALTIGFPEMLQTLWPLFIAITLCLKRFFTQTYNHMH